MTSGSYRDQRMIDLYGFIYSKDYRFGQYLGHFRIFSQTSPEIGES